MDLFILGGNSRDTHNYEILRSKIEWRRMMIAASHPVDISADEIFMRKSVALHDTAPEREFFAEQALISQFRPEGKTVPLFFVE